MRATALANEASAAAADLRGANHGSRHSESLENGETSMVGRTCDNNAMNPTAPALAEDPPPPPGRCTAPGCDGAAGPSCNYCVTCWETYYAGGVLLGRCTAPGCDGAAGPAGTVCAACGAAYCAGGVLPGRCTAPGCTGPAGPSRDYCVTCWETYCAAGPMGPAAAPAPRKYRRTTHDDGADARREPAPHDRPRCVACAATTSACCAHCDEPLCRLCRHWGTGCRPRAADPPWTRYLHRPWHAPPEADAAGGAAVGAGGAAPQQQPEGTSTAAGSAAARLEHVPGGFAPDALLRLRVPDIPLPHGVRLTIGRDAGSDLLLNYCAISRRQGAIRYEVFSRNLVAQR